MLNALCSLNHENVNAFLGLCLSRDGMQIVWNYCQKGRLEDILHNDEIELDMSFKSSIIKDIIRGIDYLHGSAVKAHGTLSTDCCLVDSRWTVRVSDYGIREVLRHQCYNEALIPPKIERKVLLQLSPEMLRSLPVDEASLGRQATVEMDSYAIGMLIYQVLFREPPFDDRIASVEELLEQIRTPDGIVVRPIVPSRLPKEFHPDLVALIKPCWAEAPELRPKMARLRRVVFNSTSAYSSNVVEHVVNKMERYAANLEQMVASRTHDLADERRRTDELLERMLPKSVAARLKLGLPVEPELFDQATVMETDVVQFTAMCSQSTPSQVVAAMNKLYSVLDAIIEKYDAYKVETVGDAYLVASGVPQRNGANHVLEIADMAVQIQSEVKSLYYPHLDNRKIELRCGIHSGPVAAGVVGFKMPHYCIFGHTVNMATQLESTGRGCVFPVFLPHI